METTIFDRLNNKHNIVLVTRCTRSENLPKMFPSVKSATVELGKRGIDVIWAIGVDVFRHGYDVDGFIRYCKECSDYGVNAIWCGVWKSRNEEDYGCSVATGIIKRCKKIASLSNYKLDLAYLLDDDTYLCNGFNFCIENAAHDIPTIWNILWNDDEIKPLQFMFMSNKSPEYCHGVDSAQFVIPVNVLEQVNWYTGGTRIDQKTLANSISRTGQFKYIDIVGCIYNAIKDSERLSYAEYKEHPCAWYHDEANKLTGKQILL